MIEGVGMSVVWETVMLAAVAKELRSLPASELDCLWFGAAGSSDCFVLQTEDQFVFEMLLPLFDVAEIHSWVESRWRKGRIRHKQHQSHTHHALGSHF